MPDDLRNTRRARLSGVHVTIEGATGERQQADVVDMSKEGLFIALASPLAIGKRLSLEIQVVGEAASWPALGRVVWIREAADGKDRPRGIGVKIIDIEDAAAAAIEKLVATRERTEPGIGEGSAPPDREKTILGVGDSAAPPAPAAPVLVAAPEREATLLGVGTTEEPARDPSLAIDLVAKKPASMPPASPTPGKREAPRESVSEPPTRSRRSGGGGLFVLALLAGLAVAAYSFRDRLLELWSEKTASEPAAAPAAPTPAPTPTPAPAPTPDPTPIAAPTAAASSSPTAAERRGIPDASAMDAAAFSAPATPPGAASTKHPASPLPLAPAPRKPKVQDENNPY
jgi:Tfp pilus assembly protein PilZ